MSIDKLNVQIDAMEAAYAVNATLRRIDERIVDHGERVAYIACQICNAGNLPLDLKTLFLLCAFHDIGAYKTDEIDRMLQFETSDVWDHSIYGYLFLKYMTPLSDCSEAILYHHSKEADIQQADFAYRDYASLIHLADRMDVALTYQTDNKQFDKLFQNSNALFRDDYIAIARKCIANGSIIESIQDGSYLIANRSLLESFSSSTLEALDYLKMVIYAIDFRSDHTVTHTINTVSLAVLLAQHFDFPEDDVNQIYLGALLHDVGKIAIPFSILESPGKLSDDQMVIMRTHVVETEKIIRGIVPDSICNLALRHHEKLDGTGYPYGLNAKDLTFAQRIIAVADIVSALSSRRSYKESFPKEKTISILRDLSPNKLDEKLCAYVCDNYDYLLEATEEERNDIICKYQEIHKEFQVIQAQKKK